MQSNVDYAVDASAHLGLGDLIQPWLEIGSDRPKAPEFVGLVAEALRSRADAYSADIVEIARRYDESEAAIKAHRHRRR